MMVLERVLMAAEVSVRTARHECSLHAIHFPKLPAFIEVAHAPVVNWMVSKDDF